MHPRHQIVDVLSQSHRIQRSVIVDIIDMLMIKAKMVIMTIYMSDVIY